jgi:hypothetical protein
VKLAPVPKITPVLAFEYQLMIPADEVAVKVTVPLPQTLPGVVLVIIGIGLTVTVTAVLAGLEQPDVINASA